MDDDTLKWNLPENLRWLVAEDKISGGYAPCGYLNSSLVTKAAEMLEVFGKEYFERLSQPQTAMRVNRQKFDRFDLVRIAADLGPHMRHFSSDCEAIVMASYKDKFGGDNIRNYCVFIPNKGESAWYGEENLTLISPYQKELYYEWLDNYERRWG